MDLKVIRKTFTPTSTIGELFVDGKFECYTLEDPVRERKIKHVTAIAAGVYTVIITMSARFKRLLPLLLDVPEFEGVRIHPGNKPEDTDGCILVGRTRTSNFVGESRAAFDALFPKMQAAAARKETITLTIVEQRG